jgi:predicted regulator of Ras-like GTPase activity (Roadblock/LC7/MglB family)
MSFSETLREAVERVEGAVAAIILASDGIPVEEHVTERLIDFTDLSAEASTLIKDIELASEELHLGEAREFALISERCGIFLRKITEEYYFALVLRPEGNFGKARFILKILIPRIEEEF